MKKYVAELMKRYIEGRKTGSYPYFDAEEIDDLLESLEEDDNFANHEDLLDLGLSLHPGNSTLLIRKSRLQMYDEDYQQALETLDSISETGNVEVDMLRLECYCELGYSDEIVKNVESLITSHCEYAESVLEFIVPLLMEMNMNDTAIDLIRLGLDIFPENLLLMDELSYAFEMEGNYEKAIKICDKLIDKNPHSYDNWYNIGRLYSLNGNYSEAIEAFEFARACSKKKNHKDEELDVLMAYCSFMNENYEKALELYSKILSNCDKNVYIQIKTMIAECYAKLEDFERAFQTLHSIIDSDTTDSYTNMNYVRCSMETDRKQEASRVLRRTAGLLPAKLRPLTDMALALLEKGQTNRALFITDEIMRCIDEEDTEDFFPDSNTGFLAKHPKTWGYYFNQKHIPLDKIVETINDPIYRN